MEDFTMTEAVIGLDDLVRQIWEHLAETDEEYRARYAIKVGANFTSDDDVLAGVDEVLSDPNTDAQVIINLANELLTATYSYEGDSIVTVQYPATGSSFSP
jgi:hypothetical protein